MNLETQEMNMLQTMEVPDCPLFGKGYDSNEEECQNCLDSEDCQVEMSNVIKPKKKKLQKKEKKVEVKQETKPKKEKRVKEAKPIVVFNKIEFKEYAAATMYSEMDYVEEIKAEKEKKVVKSKEKGMRKPPFVGRGGKGNTTSYIEWLLASGKWTIEEMVQKANYYLGKYGKRPVKMEMDKYIKACVVWLVKNKNVTETISEDGKIKLSL